MTSQTKHMLHSQTQEIKGDSLFGFIYHNMNEATIILDSDYRIISVNSVVTKLTNYTEQELIGKHLSFLLSKTNTKETLNQIYGNVTGNGWSGEVFKRCKDGHTYAVSFKICPLRNTEDGITNYIVYFMDLSNQKISESQLRLAAKAIENTSEGVIVTDENKNILSVNPAFITVTGYTEEEVIGENPKILQSGVHDAKFYQNMWKQIYQTGYWRGEIWNKRKNGSIYPEWSNICSIKDDDGNITNYVAVFSDITERKQAEERLRKLAHYDILTGVPNRYLYNERLKEYIEEAKRNEQQIAVLFLDLDRFKMINDTLGHNIGDLLLQEVTRRLKTCLEKKDMIARLGGDEFTIVLPFIKNQSEIINVINQIMEIFKRPFYLAGQEVFMSTSVGVSLYPNDGDDEETLLKKADLAMYQAKENGRNNFAIYCDDKHAINEQDVKLEHLLRKAITGNELIIHYQPQINTKTNDVSCIEALLRWNQPKLGMIQPDEFIPLAEKTGLIIEIGDWVLKNACMHLKELHKQGYTKLHIGVNISAIQFQKEDFVEKVEAILNEVDLHPRFLELELTESMIMPKAKEMNLKLVQLKQLGVKLSIDDFGTGYSSLSYLSRFPIDSLKIDRSFIRNVSNYQEDASIVKAILTMAHSLNLNVVAEGVESKKHLQHLINEKCDTIQGFFISKPLDFNDLQFFLTTWQPQFMDRS